MARVIRSIVVLLALASVCVADGFTDDNETPFEPFVSEKAELFRFSRSALKGSRVAKYEQRQEQQVESDQLTRAKEEQQQVDLSDRKVEQQQQVVGANELPAFSGGKTTGSQVVAAADDQNQEQHHSTSSHSSSSSAAKKSALSKTITTTTTTTTTTQQNQDQPQVAQIKEIRVHTVPLSEAVHYANYVVVPTHTSGGASKAAHLEESSSSSSSSHKSSSSTSSETEQVAVAPAPTVVYNPAPPASVSPDCVLHRLVIERPASSQLVVNVPSEVQVSRSSSSHSSKIISSVAAAAPQHTVYTYRSVFAPPAPIVSARVVAAPPPTSDGLKEEHFNSESRSSREESHGLGHSISSSSSSSSSSRSSKSSSTTTTSQTAALVAPPPPPVQTVTIVRQAPAQLVAVKAAPLVEVSSGRSNDVSVNVDHRQSGPNYNYGYSIKQHSSEPGTKGVVVGDRVVYLK